MSLTMGVLVTNYNTWDLTAKCIAANVALCGPRLSRLLILDDFSTEPCLEKFDTRVEIIYNETNLGLVKSLNKGVNLLDSDIIVIFDSDAYPLTDYYDIVQDTFASDPELALLGFHTVDDNNSPTASYDTEPEAIGLVLGQAMDAQYRSIFKPKNNNICIYTCAMAVRRDAFLELGGFDEQFDWLDLDLDFSMRVSRSQWKQKVTSDVIAFHKGGGAPQITRHRILRHYKNRWYLLRKHNKITHPHLIKNLILIRLQCEYLFLCIAGRWVVRDAIRRQDKLEGRKNLIQYCRKYYI